MSLTSLLRYCNCMLICLLPKPPIDFFSIKKRSGKKKHSTHVHPCYIAIYYCTVKTCGEINGHIILNIIFIYLRTSSENNSRNRCFVEGIRNLIAVQNCKSQKYSRFILQRINLRLKGSFVLYYYKLVGFGRACAPVRCAHPSFWAQCHIKPDAARPPAHRSFAAFYSTPRTK
jgi:hypothetical protein